MAAEYPRHPNASIEEARVVGAVETAYGSLEALLPSCRAKTVALEKLTEAMLWAEIAERSRREVG